MLGAISGDVIGSVYETKDCRTTEFELFSHASHFTDDSVLTVAIAEAVMLRKPYRSWWQDGREAKDLYAQMLKQFGNWYPHAGYGQMFKKWLKSESLRGYGSYANGGAMRVSPIGYAFDTLDDVLREAKWSAAVTHNHRKGIRGAQAVAAAVFLARTGEDKVAIRTFIEERFRYDLSRTLDEIRPTYGFNPSADGSVPQALTAFLESDDVESAIRLAISIGGDSDTIACIAGGVAEAYYKHIPRYIVGRVMSIVDGGLVATVRQFGKRHGISGWWGY